MSNKAIKHVIDVPEDIYIWLRKIQSGMRFKYNKTVSQIQMAFHLKPDEIQSEDYDKVIDNLYDSLTKCNKEQESKKKDNPSNISE